MWRLRSSFKKSKRWQPLKLNSNPPLSPFFKGEIFSVRFSPLFAKEGKGRFSDGMTRELCRELLGQDTRAKDKFLTLVRHDNEFEGRVVYR